LKSRILRKQLVLVLAMVLICSSILAAIGAPNRLLAAESGSGNLIQNSSFEQVNEQGAAIKWDTFTMSGQPQFIVSSTVYHSGAHSYQISAEELSRGLIKQMVQLTPEQVGKEYVFRQWIKTDTATLGRAYARVQMYDSAGQRIGDLIESASLEGENDWTLVEKNITIPSNAVRILWEGFLENTTGSVWFDDVQLVERQPVTPAVPELLVNGGFDKVTNNKADNWGTYTFSGQPEYAVDSAVVRSGSHSYRIQAEVNSRGSVNQPIKFTPEQKGKKYRMQQWLRTEDFTGKAYMRVQVYNTANTRISYIESSAITSSGEWTVLEKIVEIAPEADRMVLEFFFENGTGTVWYDDTSFKQWIPLESIALSQTNVTLAAGSSHQLHAAAIPANAVDANLVWTSSNASIATVEAGLVTAHTEGIALITVAGTGTSSGISASAIIIVGSSGGITVPNYQEEVTQNQFVSGNVLGTVEGGQMLVYSKLSEPNNGLLHVLPDGRWDYYPNPSFHGSDVFFILVEDESGAQAVSRIDVLVTAAYAPPQLDIGIHPTDKNKPVSGGVTVLSNSSGPLQYAIEVPPQHGTVHIDSSGKWTYNPNQDYTGNDSFTVQAASQLGGSTTTVIHVYVAPTAEEIITQLNANNTGASHPRLLATEADFARIRGYVDNQDPNIVPWFAAIKQEADNLLPLPPKPYGKPDGLRLDTTSAARITVLAFTYQVTGDQVYADRAWEELEYVASAAYPDWSPGHYLDTATMTQGVALGYDWLYEALTDNQRSTIRTAIAVKGLTPAIPMYIDKTYWWVYNRDNWNFVCNAGMALGALAIADEEEELAGLILREAFKSIQFGLPQYAPDGSSKEGPGYWEYGSIYLVYFLSALETALGNDYGFIHREGIEETPLYPIHVAGPKGAFNYFDNGDSLIPGRLLLWFAERFNKPEYTWYHQFVQGKTESPGIYDLLWYRAETYGATPPAELDREFVVPHAVTMRSGWNDPNALFVGFKGGENGAPHGDLDTGSFVFDASGVRWALDLGKEDYNLPGYWDMAENALRWTYYRKRAEGHNTLVINPSAGPDQSVRAVSEIIRTEFGRSEGSFAIADMTPAYSKQAAYTKRGTALLNNRRQFLVQDEIKLKTPSELYWLMHTKATIEIDPDGTTAILSQDGRKLAVQIISPAAASFSVLPAEPMQTTPNPDGQMRNLGVKRLAIHMQDVLETTISVQMTPLMEGDALPAIDAAAVVPLDAWQFGEGELAKLSGLSIDAVPLDAFESGRFVYDVELPKDQSVIPLVAASAPEGLQVAIHQASQLPGTARIEVTNPNDLRSKATYYVVFKRAVEVKMPSEESRITPVTVTASTHDGNVPENTLDGNRSTRWSAEGEQWIAYDLGSLTEVAALTIAWYQGHLRASYFNIELSVDGSTWKKVFEGTSAGNTNELELFPFESDTARYVRINGFGNTLNRWNSIAEVHIYGSDSEEPGGGDPGGGEPGGGEPGSGEPGGGDPGSGEPGGGDPGSGEPGGGDPGNGNPGSGEPSGGGPSDSELGSGGAVTAEPAKEVGGEQEQSGGSKDEAAPIHVANPFTDIANHWAKDAIVRAFAKGIANGYSDGSFRADQSITREQFTVLLMRAMRTDGEAPTGLTFTDAKLIGNWAQASIAQAVQAGFINGYGDGSFRPQADLSRAQLAVIVARALNLPTTQKAAKSFGDDREIPVWAKSAVHAVHQQGLMVGRGDNRFVPNDRVTRAEAIVVLLRALEAS